MPELPEVEFCRRYLKKYTYGQRVIGFSLLDPRVVRASTADRPSSGLAHAEERLKEVFKNPAGELLRHGKRLLWIFGEQSLVLHLGMTGKWTKEAGKHIKLRLDFEQLSLYFIDPRLLGGVVPATRKAGEKLLVAGHGPDALGQPLPHFNSRRAIKVVLMDQSLLAGVGNVQAMEALWRAKIHPETPAAALTSSQYQALDQALQEQLAWTLNLLEQEEEIHYVEEAGAINPFLIYQRTGSPCPRCSTPLARSVQAGRGSWWCPRCQPSPTASC